MTMTELRQKADRDDAAVIKLEKWQTVLRGDYVEWTPGAWTTVDGGSPFAGESVADCIVTSAYRLVRLKVLAGAT